MDYNYQILSESVDLLEEGVSERNVLKLLNKRLGGDKHELKKLLDDRDYNLRKAVKWFGDRRRNIKRTVKDKFSDPYVNINLRNGDRITARKFEYDTGDIIPYREFSYYKKNPSIKQFRQKLAQHRLEKLKELRARRENRQRLNSIIDEL